MATKFIAVKTRIPIALPDPFIKKEMELVVKPAQKDFQDFVSSWRSKNRPTIKIKVSKTILGWEAFTGVESNWTQGSKATKEDKFMFVTRGTSVRYATMQRGFAPKTSKGLIKSGSGSPPRDPAYVSTIYPNDGIEAREVEEAVAKKEEKRIKTNMRLILIKGLIKSKVGLI